MPKQIQKEKVKVTSRTDNEAVAARAEVQDWKAQKAQEAAQEIKDNLDDLLDEIDAVLESNAEEFVKAYVQKGGE